MYRRGFLSTIGSMAAIPAVGLAKAPPKNWHCLIGGNRCGKSTKAAKMVSSREKIEIVSFEEGHSKTLASQLLPEKKIGDLRLVSKAWHSWLRDHRKAISFLNAGHKWALWIDETVPSFCIEEIADLYDMIVLSSWPATGLQDSFFYQECLKMGTVEHMRMLPHIEKKLVDRDAWADDEEYVRRVLGQFPA